MTQVIYIAFTSSPTNGDRRFIAVYAKSSYQKAYNWLADIAERHGGLVEEGTGDTAVFFTTHKPGKHVGILNGQTWWLERHEI